MKRVRGSLLVTAAVAVVALSGCFRLPGAAPVSAAPTAPVAATTSPSETEPTTSTPTTSSAAAGPAIAGAVTAELPDGLVWEFAPTSIAVVPADSAGQTAPAGFKIVVVQISGNLISGDGDFYFDFMMKVVDGANGDLWGLSSGTDYLGENDLFFAGSGSFTDADAIYLVPESVELGQIYVIANDTGEDWTFDVPVEQ